MTGTGELKLSAQMKSLWQKPFGFHLFAIDYLNFGIGIHIGVPVVGFEADAKLQFGKIGSQNVIHTDAFIGMDTNPYLYAKINPFTLESIVSALDLQVDLPQSYMSIGFPNGVMVSFVAGLMGRYIICLFSLSRSEKLI